MPGNVDLIKALGTRFIERRDVKAVQGEVHAKYGGDVLPWQPIESKFTMTDFEDHLAGRRTFGHYMVSPEGNTKLFAFDLDFNKEGAYYTVDSEPGVTIPCNPREAWADQNHPAQWCLKMQMRCLAEGISSMTNRLVGVPVAVAYSGGKGLHVYGFCGTQPAEVARTLAVGVMEELGVFEPTRGENFYRQARGDYNNITIEVFPKQNSIGADGFGNLMALPLGIHRVTGLTKHFCRLDIPYVDGWREMDPMNALSGDLMPWQ